MSGRSICLFVCVCVCVCVCGVRQVRLCVSYAECGVGVDLLERLSVWCWAGPPVCVCLVSCMFACVYVGECGVGQVRLCVCVCVCVWCVVLARSIYVCVCMRNAE